MRNNDKISIRLFKYLCIIFMFFAGLLTIVASGGGGGSDDNGNNDNTDITTYDISGYVQKGPFISGSSVTIYELDSSLNQTGVSFQTQTVDDFGSFILPDKVSSDYVEIISSGYYFNEVDGNLSSSPITLSSISKVTAGKDVYVNILTCLAGKRIRYLVQNEGKSFDNAMLQAEEEILTIFSIDETEVSDFDQMNISEEGNSNAMLLAVSVILQGNNTVAELSELISKIGLDIETDGTLDNAIYRDEITNNAMLLDWNAIRMNLENRYLSLGLPISVPNFEDYLHHENDLFSLGQSFVTGIFTQSVKAEDLDGDGHLDLAVACGDMGSVSVYLNNGDGTFASPAIYNSGCEYEHTYDVVTGDLNNDGAPDLVAINFRTVSVLLNNGNGTFTTAVEYPVEADWFQTVGRLGSAATGDFNDDGDLDLAVTSFMPDNIFVFVNNGDGSFTNEVSYSAHIQPHELVSDDLDGDGHIDLAVAESYYWLGPSGSSVSVFINKGNGTFVPEVDYGAGEYPYSIAIGDLDGDSNLDLAAIDNNTEDDSYEIAVLLNNGDGSFATAVIYNAGNTHGSMVIGDLDGDADLDMTVTNFGGISIFLNNGDGTFAKALDTDLGISGLYHDATLGDFDGDSDLDMAVIIEGETIAILMNNTFKD